MSTNNLKTIDGVILTNLKKIHANGGDVMHALKKSDAGYVSFGEAYFSNVHYGAIKAWKRHRDMVLNLIVPVGKIKFVIYDDREFSPTYNTFQEIFLSREDNFIRLTVPPLLWVGFKGLSKDENIVLNIANIEHKPEEVDQKLINELNYNWSI